MSTWPPVATLLPHGPAALCIDEIVEFVHGLHLVAAVRVRPGVVVYDKLRNGIPAWATIEVMAQAAGLYRGLAAGPSTRGAEAYLLRMRHFRARRQVFMTDTELIVAAVCEGADSGGTSRFQCRILVGGQEIVSAQLTLGGARGHRGLAGGDTWTLHDACS